jgi:hypothetical protein
VSTVRLELRPKCELGTSAPGVVRVNHIDHGLKPCPAVTPCPIPTPPY